MKTRPIEQLADWVEVTAARFGLQNPVLSHHLKKTRQIIKALKREAKNDKRNHNI